MKVIKSGYKKIIQKYGKSDNDDERENVKNEKRNTQSKEEEKIKKENAAYIKQHGVAPPPKFEEPLDEIPWNKNFTIPITTTTTTTTTVIASTTSTSITAPNNVFINFSSTTDESSLLSNKTKWNPSSLANTITKSLSFDFNNSSGLELLQNALGALDKKNSFDMIINACCSSPKNIPVPGVPQAFIKEEKSILLYNTSEETELSFFETNLDKILENLLQKATLNSKPLYIPDSNLERLFEDIISELSPEEAAKYVHTITSARSNIAEGIDFVEDIMGFLNTNETEKSTDSYEENPIHQQDSLRMHEYYSPLSGTLSSFDLF